MRKFSIAGMALALILIVSHSSHSLTYDYCGTVLYDNQASDSFRPGLGNNFSGSLLIGDDGLMTISNSSTGSIYNIQDSFTAGQFTHDGIDFFYAYSQAADQSSQMGLIWWSEPKLLKIQESYFHSVTGLAFYLENYNYTPAYLLAQSLKEYVLNGNISGLLSNIYNPQYTGCQVNNGNAFLGFINQSFIPEPATNPVPIPTSIWLLGSGLFLLFGRSKKFLNRQ